jgi:hypothetical protein
MTRALPALIGLAALVAYGAAEGVTTHRWWDSGELDRAASRLPDVPKTVGDWTSEDLSLDARTVAVAELKGYVHRRYVHRPSGEVVTVLIVLGRGGPVSVHTPDVCFAGVGYQMAGDPPRHPVEAAVTAGPAEFRAARFGRTGPDGPENLALFWGWNDSGRWEAPDNPRLRFVPSPAVYKMYLIHQVGPDTDPTKDRVLADFARAFLPAAEKALFPTPGT